MKRYKVTGTVVIVKEITEEFKDDGKTELYDQAYEALRDADDLPIGCRHDIDEITDITFAEIVAETI